MADDISNKTLAALLAVAVVVSLGGTLIVLKSGPMITGLSTDIETGTAQANIQENAQLDIPGALIDFGSITVATGNTSCTADSGYPPGSAGTGTCNGTSGFWATIVDGTNSDFRLTNTGNVNLTVDIDGDTAANFIGGTSPSYKLKSATSNTNGGCDAGTQTTWVDVSTDPTVCSILAYGANNAFEVDLNITVPQDAPPGAKSDTVTFTGTSL